MFIINDLLSVQQKLIFITSNVSRVDHSITHSLHLKLENMSLDDVPLPTNKTRRRSIFDDKNNNQDENGIEFPAESEIYYSIEYLEKIKTEIEQWKMHIIKMLEWNNKFKSKKMELQNTVIDENILSSEQQDFIASFNVDEYLRRMSNFCDRAAIIAHKMQYKPDSEVENRYLTTRSKLERLIFRNDNQQN